MKTSNRILVTGLALAAIWNPGAQAAQKNTLTIAGIPFVGYGQSYRTKIDFAELDERYPLPAEALQKLKPSDLEKMDQEQLDQLYARLSSGPLPDGKYDGFVYLARGGGMRLFGSYLDSSKLPSELRAVYSKTASLGLDEELPRKFLQMLWRGKNFYPKEGVLKNRLLGSAAPLWDKLGVPWSSFLPLRGDVERFPARMYCGLSLIDARRESIILDYVAADTLPGFKKIPDALATESGLGIRDEIRMIRPGFYLGRAYSQRIFLLSFAVYQPEIADKAQPIVAQPQDQCWSGTQERKSSLARASD